MEYHLERGLRLHTKPEYRSLYGWAINEVDAQDQQIGHDQIPWPWSLYFTATSCVLRDGIEIRLQYKNHEATPEPEIAQRQLIRVQLRPNDMRTTSVGRLTRCSAQTAPSIASSWKSNRSPTQTGNSIRTKTIEFGRPSMRSFVNWSRVQYRRQLTWLTLR